MTRKSQRKCRKDINRAHRMERKARLIYLSHLRSHLGITDWFCYFDEAEGEWKDSKYEKLYERWSEYEHEHCKKASALRKKANDLQPLPF